MGDGRHVVADLYGHAIHERDDVEAIGDDLHPGFFGVEVDFPPVVVGECVAEGFGDCLFELGAGDFLGCGAIEGEEIGIGYFALGGVELGEFEGFGDVGVVDDEVAIGVDGEAFCGGEGGGEE